MTTSIPLTNSKIADDGGRDGAYTEEVNVSKRQPGKKDSTSTSTPQERQFMIVAVLFQSLLLVLYAISTDYSDATVDAHSDDHEWGTEPFYFYAMYQDVHAMMFVGFGFLMTFLRRYGFGALTFNFLLCAFGIQWGMYIFHMIPWVFNEHIGPLHINAYKLIDGDIATAVVLISFGALLGRVNPAQLLVMCFFELFFWALNFYICVELLHIVDVGGSIVVHTFGAYFGLAASFVCGLPSNDDENKSMYHSDMFSMIGTLFLWLYWPSFNGFFANREYYYMDRAFVNTVLGLCGSTVATFIMSRVVKKGKFDMVHIQNATLAGGVAVGAAADLYLHPAGALGIGFFAGLLSVCGYEYLSDMIKDRLAVEDTCGVHNLHGMPGILGGIVSAIALAAADGTGVYPTAEDAYPFEHPLRKQAAFQISGVCVTLGIAVLSGLMVGVFLKFMESPANEFTDYEHFIVPKDEEAVDFFTSTIRRKNFSGNRSNDDFDALNVDTADELEEVP